MGFRAYVVDHQTRWCGKESDRRGLSPFRGAGLQSSRRKCCACGATKRKASMPCTGPSVFPGSRALHDFRSRHRAGARGRGRRESQSPPHGRDQSKQAAPGTIRADFAASIEENVVHGSDGPDTATAESPSSSLRRRFVRGRANAPAAKPGKRNLLGLTADACRVLRAWARTLPRAAIMRWMYQRHVPLSPQMTDLSAPFAQATRGDGDARRAPRAESRAFGRRHAQVAPQHRRRASDRDRVHSRAEPRHAVHLFAGGLRARLRVLRYRP